MKEQYKHYYVKLGLNIQYYRKLAGLTQERLAEIIGIDVTHMGYIEQARSGASFDVLFAIAEALHVPVKNLFDFRE